MHLQTSSYQGVILEQRVQRYKAKKKKKSMNKKVLKLIHYISFCSHLIILTEHSVSAYSNICEVEEAKWKVFQGFLQTASL